MGNVFWTIIALVMTVLMGGIIAYNGDLIGRKFGKRRMSLFGMRPKHTAILITSLTGVLISAGTTGILFLVVTPVREVIISGEDALRLNKTLKVDNKGLELQNTQLKVQVEAEHKTIDAAERNTAKAQARYAAALNNLHLAEEQVRKTKSSAIAARLAEKNALAHMKIEMVKTRDLTAFNSSLREQNDILSDSNASLTQKNGDLARQNDTLNITNKTLKADNETKRVQNEEYDRQNGELAQQNDSLVRNNETLLRVNRNLLSENKDLLDKNQSLGQESSRLASDNKRLSELNQKMVALTGPGFNSLIDAYRALRTRRVAVHGGEDLARVIIPAHSSPDTVRKLLQTLMHDASESALQKGASAGDQARAVQVVDKQFYTQTSTGAVVPIEISGQERVDTIISRMAYRDSDYCVLALAVANSVEQERAAIDFQPFPDKLVFNRGDVVAFRRFDASRPPDKLFGDIVTFLKELGQDALQKGMIPRIDPMTGEPQVGSLNAGDIVSLTERLRYTGGKVRVQAIASADISAADTLDLQFKISSAR